MGRDYIDIYHIHWPNADSDLDEVMQTLLSLKQSGKIREIGVSNFGKYDIEDILKYNCVVSNQMPYNMLWRSIEYDILPMCIENNIGVLTYSSLAQGLLTGKYKSADDVPVGRARTRIFSKERPQTRHGEDGCEEEAFAAIEALRGICDEIGQPMNRVAISWLIHRKGISSVVAGARTAEQAKLNAAAADIELSEDIIRRIDGITESVKEHIGKNPDPWDCRVRY